LHGRESDRRIGVRACGALATLRMEKMVSRPGWASRSAPALDSMGPVARECFVVVTGTRGIRSTAQNRRRRLSRPVIVVDLLFQPACACPPAKTLLRPTTGLLIFFVFGTANARTSVLGASIGRVRGRWILRCSIVGC
jgi:hypothetical protein